MRRLILLLILLALLLPVTAEATVARVASGSNIGTNISTLSVTSLDCSGADAMSVFSIIGGAPDVSSVTFGSDSFSQKHVALANGMKIELWGGHTAGGTHDVTVNWSFAASGIDNVIIAQCFSGSDATTPIDRMADANGGSPNPTIDITTSTDDFAISGIGYAGTFNATPGGGQTEDGDRQGSFTNHGAAGDVAGASGTTTLSWTITSGAWNEVGARIKASAGGGGGTTNSGLGMLLGVRRP